MQHSFEERPRRNNRRPDNDRHARADRASGFRQNFHEAGRQLIDFLLQLMDGASPQSLKMVHKMAFFERT